MDDDQSKRYESIDALIKAAEVLERNEFLTKNSNIAKGNEKLSKFASYRPLISNPYSNVKLKYSKEKQLYDNGQSKERFSESFFQTIKCINELRSDEHWYSLIENKLKSDNRALYHELNNLKRKLNKIKSMTSGNKKFKSVDHSYEDEDTSTASEDEDYNKYDNKIMVDNVDDATDDASECEEIKPFNRRNKMFKWKHIANHSIVRSNNVVNDGNSKPTGMSLIIEHKSRKSRTHDCHSPELLKPNHPFTLKHSPVSLLPSVWDHCHLPHRQYTRSITQNGLISASNREVSSKVHRIA